MNREILFKAKTEMIVRSYNNGLDDGIWVKGYLRCDCGMWLIYQFEYDRADQVAYEVNPETICQYTGLKDKNGNKIWENDILMCHGNKKDLCKVCFGEFKVIDIEDMVAVDIVQGWYYKPLKTDTLSKCEPFCYEMPLTNYYLERMEAEVIGNIFDNPELLEVEE